MLVSIDYETHLISPEFPFPRPVCLSAVENGFNKKLLTGKEIPEYLKRVLQKDTIIAHNATFECGVTAIWYPELLPQLKTALSEGRIICTQILQQLLNAQLERPVTETSLSHLVEHYFKVDISAGKTNPDAWRLRYSELEHIPKAKWPKEAIEYAIMDSVWAYKLYVELKQHRLEYRRAVEAAFYLNMIGKIGIHVNQERVIQLEKEIYTKLDPIYSKLLTLNLCAPTLSKRPKKNIKELKAYVQERVKKPQYTKKGNIAVGKEALLKYYKETEDEAFKHFLDINEYDKVLTAYIKRLKNNNVILTDYSTTKSTGRTSSFSSRLYPSVNIQQMPRKVPNVTWDVRNCFIPRPGYQIVSIDYAGLELASTAHRLYKLFGYSKMRDILNEGDTPVDLHSKFACQVMSRKLNKKISYEDFIQHKKEPEYAEMRQKCKRMNLSFPGGIGYDTMRFMMLQDGIRTKYHELVRSESLGEMQDLLWRYKHKEPNLRIAQVSPVEYAIVYDELVSLKNDMFTVYPELKRFLKEEHKRHTTGEIKNMKDDWGNWEEQPMYKYKAYDFKRDWCTYTAFCNGYLMQSPSAIGATEMMIALGKKYLCVKFPCRNHQDVKLLAFIHDEVLFEVKGDYQLHIKDISEIMIDEMQKKLNSVRITVEASMMEYWSKEGGKYNVTYYKNQKDNTLRAI